MVIGVASFFSAALPVGDADGPAAGIHASHHETHKTKINLSAGERHAG